MDPGRILRAVLRVHGAHGQRLRFNRQPAQHTLMAFYSNESNVITKPFVFSEGYLPSKFEVRDEIVSEIRGYLEPATHGQKPLKVAEHYKGLGYQVEIEKELPNGHLVDIWVRNDTEEVGFEIEREVSQALSNVASCLEGGIPRVRVICLRPRNRRRIEQRLQVEIGSRKVEVRDTGDWSI